MRGEGTRVEVVTSKGCSRLLAEITASMPSFRGGTGFQSYAMESVSHLSTAPRVDELAGGDKCNGPFSGLVICVTGLSKEARKQVMAATERLGGEYSPHLHPQCTHLVVQSFHGRKFEHALKHGPKNGLSVVTLGWFVDSVRRNVRLSESLYGVKSGGDGGVAVDDLKQLLYDSGTEKSCLPFGSHECTDRSYPKGPRIHFPERDSKRISMSLPLSGYSFYIDADVSAELRTKVVEAATGEGAIFVDQWYVGCSASHVVCEGPSVRKYLGHSNNIVTPLWVLKTAREKCLQRLVHISADLARQTAMTDDFIQTGTCKEEDGGTVGRQGGAITALNTSHEERQKIANLAKDRVRKRRNFRMQTCESPILPFTPNSLLDSICWSISEPTSSATIYTESLNMVDANGQDAPVFFDAKSDEKESEASFINLSRPLTESEKSESIFKNHFLTILFPVDRFYEMGPRSRTFFSDKGFTCLQVLDYIYDFYQENMPADEIEVGIHTDSRHADRLRSMFSSEATAERGYFEFKRIDFLGSRKSFEMLKRVSVDNNSNVYELLIRA